MANNSIFTEEEIAEDMKDILEMLKLGTPYSVISEELGRSKNYIVKIKQMLIEDGKITQEEIDVYRAEYRRKRIKEKMLEKEKKENSVNEKSQKKEDNKQLILEMFKEGYSQAEIARKLQVIDSYIQKQKDELINEGKLKKSEIKRAVPQREVNESIRQKYLNPVLEMLKNGIKPFMIRKLLNITTYQIEVVLEHIRKHGLLTKEEQEKAIKAKEQRDMEFIEKSVKEGLSIKDIIEKDPTIYKSEATRLVKKLIEDKKITKKKVEKNSIKKFKESRSSKRCMTVDEQRKFVRRLAKKGYTPREIAELDVTNSIDFNRATYLKKELIKEGLLDSKNVNNSIDKRKKEDIEKKHKTDIESIINYTREGYTDVEIATILGYSRRHIYELKKEYQEHNTWFTKEELKSFRKNRHEKEKNKEVKGKQKQKREQKNLIEEYRNLKKKAIKEYHEEENGTIEFSSIEKRKEYLDYLRFLDKKGVKIEEEIKIAGEILLSNNRLIDIVNLKFIVLKYYDNFGENVTTRFINRAISSLDSPDYTQKLEELKKIIHTITVKNKINEMLRNGESASQISKKLGIYYDEVIKQARDTINIDLDER